MITNEKQYKITHAALRDFQDSLKQIRASNEQEDPILRQAQIESLESEIEALRRQVKEYEAIDAGQVPALTVSFNDIGKALALAWVDAGLTQRQLAERVGVKTQQIQRYEAQEYEPASYARLKEIAWALGIDIQVHIPLPNYVGVASTLRITTPVARVGYGNLLFYSGRQIVTTTGTPMQVFSNTTSSRPVPVPSTPGTPDQPKAEPAPVWELVSA